MTPDGQVTPVFSGILDSQSEHQINDIQVGPDGRMYVAVGPTGNSGVVDESIAPWVMESPDVHTTPCQDITLLGVNFMSADFRTEAEDDSVLTGAYVPFGTETVPGQVIPGTNKCGGSILAFDPDDALYIVDYGVVTIDLPLQEQGKPPYRYEPGTGVIWKVTPMAATAVEQLDSDLPERFVLEQNYPNPFNPSSRIRFQIVEQSPVTLRVYDVAGREVVRLVDAVLAPGTYEVEWNGRDARGRVVASGAYLYRLVVGSFEEAKTMTLMK